MVRLADVEWRLRVAAGQHCPEMAPAAGLVVDYIKAYGPGDRALARKALGLTSSPQVAAVVPGGPADAGGILPEDELLAIAGVSTSDIIAASQNPELLADEILDSIAASPPGRPLELVVNRGGQTFRKVIEPQNLCATRFILRTDKAIEAYSDEHNVAVTSALVHFARSDDEVALVAGHELAHVISRHGKTRSLHERRQMEDEADILGAALAHCAGYDILQALDFWKRFRKRDWLGWLRAPSHRSTAAREKRIRDAVPSLSCPASP